MARPFAGIRVVEVGGTLAAGAATKTLSDYGADVIKVEPPAGGEIRRLPPFPDDRPHVDTGACHLALDTGKRSVVVDLGTASGREVLGRIAAGAQLLVLHLAPDDAERVLSLVGEDGPSTVAITAHGLQGPFRDRLENDMSMFAWTTRMQHHGFAGEEPLRYAPHAATIQVGATAAAAAVAAIWAREHGGGRAALEVAGVEALAGNVDQFFVLWSFSGAEMPRPGAGAARAGYPAGTHRCADGYVVFASGADSFARLCAGMGRPELATDPRFADPAARAEHGDAFRSYFEPWINARTRDQVFTQLQATGVMVAPILDTSEMLVDRQVQARGSFVQVDQPGVGVHTIAGPPFRMPDGWEARPAPALGEHTVEVLDALGYSRDEQIALFRVGAIA